RHDLGRVYRHPQPAQRAEQAQHASVAAWAGQPRASAGKRACRLGPLLRRETSGDGGQAPAIVRGRRMMQLLQAVRQHAARQPDRVALQGAVATLSYAQLAFEIERMQRHFFVTDTAVLGLMADNCPAWAVTDLAAMDSELPLVPLPAFFS